jgi:hypothetical protein
MKVKYWAFCACVAVLSACDSPTDSGPPPGVESVNVDTAGPLFRYLDVVLQRPAALEVTYWSEGAPRVRVAADSTSNRHRIFLPRLRSSRTYSFEVRSSNTRGLSEPRTGSLTTTALPSDLARLVFTASGQPTQPLTMVELMISNTGFNGALIADANGEIVWFWRNRGQINGVSRRSNGNFVMLDADSGLVELTPDARAVHRLRNGNDKPYGLIHHDATVTAQNTVLFLARDTKVIRDTAVVGEAIWEWVPETGITTKRWSSFDHFDWNTHRGPQTAANNWMHANSIQVGPRGNIVISARNLDQVFSIAPDWRSLEWTLSGPNAMVPLPEEARFYSQHSAVEVTANRLLLFDNGLGRVNNQQWSRVAEYNINPATRTATLVWQFRPSPDINAMRVGSVARLLNGNTVAAFGWGQCCPIVVYEINPAGQVVWSLTGNEGFNRVYRMKPITDIGGEKEVS